MHVYKEVWTPTTGELLLFRREPSNISDQSAVGEDSVVGHLTCNIASVISQFLRRDINKGFVEVTGDRVNRGAGYGLEIPCTYRFYGPKLYTDRVKHIIENLQANGLL